MYTRSSAGSRSISARATVSPPNPESNIPMGRCIVGHRLRAATWVTGLEDPNPASAWQAHRMDPAADHEHWTSTVVLGDGNTAVIRPITPGDAPALEQFHTRQSPDSRYLRFFSPKPTLSEDELERFTTVDFVDRVAFVVEQHGEFIAWASYERWKNRDDAEVAFMVDDEHTGKGIATLLLEHMAAVALHNGITRFTAQTLGSNRGMLAVFAKAGWPVHRRFESGVIDVDFSLDDTSEFIDSVERREQRADSRAVARLLLPTSIAVIGASDVSLVRSDRRSGATPRSTPAARCTPSTPTSAVDGTQTFATITEIPDDVGLAVVAVPAGALAGVIDDCIAKRVRGAVVITAVDHTEVDVAALVAHARRNGLRIIGPASMGVASPRPDVTLQASLVPRRRFPRAMPPSRCSPARSGSSLLRLADSLDVGLSWFVSLGDKCDLSANDLLQFWEDDEATDVIALYTESLGDPRKLVRIARRVSTRKPIVSVRTGAALVGIGNDALYLQTGVIEVPTVAALLDTVRVFATQPLMAGNRVAVLSNARSPLVLATATLDGGRPRGRRPSGHARLAQRGRRVFGGRSRRRSTTTTSTPSTSCMRRRRSAPSGDRSRRSRRPPEVPASRSSR